MTTLADREHALEAHYAVMELAAFKTRLLHFRNAGYRIAAAAGLQDKDAGPFAEEVAFLGVKQPLHAALCAAIAAMVAEFGASMLPAAIDRLLSDHDEERPLHTADHDAERSWAGFVMEQMLLLFGLDGRHPEAS